MNLAKLQLSDVAYEVRDIYVPNTEENLPYVGLEHIEPQTLRLIGTGFSSETVSAKKKFRSGDILFGSLRPYFRKVIQAKFDGVCSTDITVIRGGEKSDQVFLFYFIASNQFINYATIISNGTRMPRAGWKILSSSFWNFPDLKSQRRIASILSAYDDLIENNTRRIRILEEMAQAVYREWFVHFRYPGHESVPLVESELGLIPQGWEVKKLGDAIELAYGKGLKSENRQEGPYPVYGSAGIVGNHDEYFVKAPGIIVGRKGNVGSVFWSYEDFYPIDTVFYVKTSLSLYYVYYDLRRQHFINNDAAVPGLSRNQAYLLPLLIPPETIQSRFEEMVKPIFDQINTLNKQNINLRQQRDLLLPRLVSGEVDVEKILGEANTL